MVDSSQAWNPAAENAAIRAAGSATTSTKLQGEAKEAPQGEGSDPAAPGGSAGAPRARGFTSESARRARETRTRKAADRKRAAEEAALTQGLTARQKLGIAVSKLDQAQVDRIVSNLANQAEQGDVKSIHALARILDQSFGRAQEEAAPATGEIWERQWEQWTPAEKASYRAALLEQRERERAEHSAAGDSTDPRTTQLDTPTNRGPATTRH